MNLILKIGTTFIVLSTEGETPVMKKRLNKSANCFVILFFRRNNILQDIRLGRVYSTSNNFTGKKNPDVILPVKLKLYRQNKSPSYSAGKT